MAIEEITYKDNIMSKAFFSPCTYHPENFHFFKGDIFEAFDKNYFNILVHQVNCRGVMGGGIARIVKQKFPFVFDQYQNLCASKVLDRLFGYTQLVNISNDYEPKRMVANLFGQQLYGTYCRQTNYEEFYNALVDMKEQIENFEADFPPESPLLNIAFPYNIGCGLAGGDFRIVLSMIESVFGENVSENDKGTEHRLVEFYILPDELNTMI